MKKSERTLAAAPPFQIEPAPLGFDLVPVKPLTGCIHTATTYLIGASFVSLAPTFFMKKSERTLAAAPPFQIEPAPLGFDLVPVKPLKHQITETGAPF